MFRACVLDSRQRQARHHVHDHRRFVRFGGAPHLHQLTHFVYNCAWPETALLAKCEDGACQGAIVEKRAILTNVEYSTITVSVVLCMSCSFEIVMANEILDGANMIGAIKRG